MSRSLRIFSRLSVAAIAVALLSADAVASETQTSLHVSLTVVPSCTTSTEPTPSAVRVAMQCSSGSPANVALLGHDGHVVGVPGNAATPVRVELRPSGTADAPGPRVVQVTF